jgi:hypothetical protein
MVENIYTKLIEKVGNNNSDRKSTHIIYKWFAIIDEQVDLLLGRTLAKVVKGCIRL